MHMNKRTSLYRMPGDEKSRLHLRENIRHYFPAHICSVLINFCFA
jgi:hypothetical protein